LAGGPGVIRVERVNGHAVSRDDPSQADLSSRVAPSLCQGTGWYVHFVSQFQ
jgi:hypothetical protein